MSVQKHLRFFVLLHICVCIGCKEKHSKIALQANHRIYQYLSWYYNDHIDSLKNNLVIYDSAALKSLDLSFYYFSDRRVESKHWKLGVMITSSNNNNFVVFSERLPRHPLKNGAIVMPYVPHLIQNVQIKSEFLGRNVDAYQIEQIPSATILNDLLNSLPVHIKAGLNRISLDSCFVLFFKQKKLRALREKDILDSLINSMEYKELHTQFASVENPQKLKKDMIANYRRLKDFQKITDKSFGLPNFFFYRDWENTIWLITVNEEFKDYEFSVRYYNTLLSSGTNMQIRIYRLVDVQ